ncbi:MAG: methylmalonyl-CoA epimerase [Candidatus Bathyarchaeota archaeon]|nr:methylmalonyl-CoA epimerase [Candidatus Bathyarchaeota archaeon]
MLITGLEHIGVAVHDLDAALRIYEQILGLRVKQTTILAEEKIRTAILLAGKIKIELMEPTDEEGPVARFLKKRGEGVHHIAFTVTNLESFLKNIKEKGVVLVDEKPRIGAGGYRMAFLHPKSTKSVLVELCET